MLYLLSACFLFTIWLMRTSLIRLQRALATCICQDGSEPKRNPSDDHAQWLHSSYGLPTRTRSYTTGEPEWQQARPAHALNGELGARVDDMAAHCQLSPDPTSQPRWPSALPTPASLPPPGTWPPPTAPRPRSSLTLEAQDQLEAALVQHMRDERDARDGTTPEIGGEGVQPASAPARGRGHVTTTNEPRGALTQPREKPKLEGSSRIDALATPRYRRSPWSPREDILYRGIILQMT